MKKPVYVATRDPLLISLYWCRGWDLNPQHCPTSPRLRFLRSLSPSFSFLLRGISFCANKSLAEDEKIESKTSSLSSLRKDFVRGPLEKSGGSTEGKLSSMWQSESLESCEKKNSHRSKAALLLSELRDSIYCKVVAVFFAIFLFFEEALF
jgi:hypothetical protein